MPRLVDPTRVGVQLRVAREIRAFHWSALVKGPRKKRKHAQLYRQSWALQRTAPEQSANWLPRAFAENWERAPEWIGTELQRGWKLPWQQKFDSTVGTSDGRPADVGLCQGGFMTGFRSLSK